MRRLKILHTRPMPLMPGTVSSVAAPCAIRAWTPRRTCSGCASRNRDHWARINTPLWRHTKAIHSAWRPVHPERLERRFPSLQMGDHLGGSVTRARSAWR